MSVFRVKLSNVNQGLLDLDPSTHPLATGTGSEPATYGNLGYPFGTNWPGATDYSLQRQMFAAGPNHTYRLLSDGETFTDCNYWKQFAYPQVALEHAFIETVTDDGSIWSNIPEENTFAVGDAFTATTTYGTPADSVVDFVTTHGGPARMLIVQNLDATNDIIGELNGDSSVTFVVQQLSTMTFSMNDLAITSVRFKSSASTVAMSYVASIRSVPTS